MDEEQQADTNTSDDPALSDWDKFEAFLTESLGVPEFLVSNFGALALVIALIILCWWKWDHLRKLPGISHFLERRKARKLPKADPTRLTVLIALLPGDDEPPHETHKNIVDLLDDLAGVEVLSVDRTLWVESLDPDEQRKQGHKQARDLLKQSGAEVLIWGRIMVQDQQRIPRLFLTHRKSSAEEDSSVKGRQYALETTQNEIQLPSILWADLWKVLALLIEKDAAIFREKFGSFVAPELETRINQVRALIDCDSKYPIQGEERAVVLSSLGACLTLVGEQKSDDSALKHAVGYFREAVELREENSGTEVWAHTMHFLGRAIFGLCEHHVNPVMLAEAGDCIVAAGEVFDKLTDDELKANVRVTLGLVLTRLGDQRGDKDAYFEALSVLEESRQLAGSCSSDFVMFSATANKAIALMRLGDREQNPDRYKEAIADLEVVLKIDREKLPMYYPIGTLNLIAAKSKLAIATKDVEMAQDAINQCQNAKSELPDDVGSLIKANGEYTLAVATIALGVASGDDVHFDDAIIAYNTALEHAQDGGSELLASVIKRELANIRTLRVQT